MENLRLANILPYISTIGVVLYLNNNRLKGEDYLQVMKDSYNYNVIGIMPYSDEKIEIHIVEGKD